MLKFSKLFQKDQNINKINIFCKIFVTACGVMVSVSPSSAVDREFESPLGKTIDYGIGICCFSVMQAALRRKNKDCLARKSE